MQMTVCSWCQEKNLKDISNTLTKELQSCGNKLSLHLGKTEVILWIKEKTKKKNAQDFEVKCNGVSIQSVSVVK